MILLLLIIKIIVGSFIAFIGYSIGRKIIDAIGIEKYFKEKHWQYSISQLGELIMLASLAVVIILAVKLVDNLAQLFN